MHGDRPELYVETLLDWVRSLDRLTIDVHAHYLPAATGRRCWSNGHGQPDGFPQIPEWSADEHVAAMDRLGIATSLLSISSPGVHLADDAAAGDLARRSTRPAAVPSSTILDGSACAAGEGHAGSDVLGRRRATAGR